MDELFTALLCFLLGIFNLEKILNYTIKKARRMFIKVLIVISGKRLIANFHIPSCTKTIYTI